MIKPTLVSIVLHVAAAGALVGSRPAIKSAPPRAQPVAVRLIGIPGGGSAETSSKAPGLVGGHFSSQAKPKKPRSVNWADGRPWAGARTSTLASAKAPSAPTTEIVPVGSGVGAEGVGELGSGGSQALVQERIQQVADYWSGSQKRHTETFTFSVDSDGDVSDRGHESELDKIIHLAEPFPPGSSYVVTVRY